MVVSGCFLLPMRHFADICLKNYLNVTCMLAMFAAFSTAGYSMIDNEALKQLRFAMKGRLGTVSTTLIYACLQALMVSLWLALFVVLRRTGRSSFREVLRTNKSSTILAGIGIYGTYALVLISMAFVKT